MSRMPIVVALVAAGLSSDVALSQPVCQPPEAGAFGFADRIGRLLINGDTAYMVSGSDLVVLDITQPTEPLEIGRLAGLGAQYDLERVGDVLFIVDGAATGGLNIVDISIARAPVLVHSIPFSSPQALTVEGSLLYMLQYPAQIRILDVSNPFLPAQIGHLALPRTSLTDIAVLDSTIYVSYNDIIIIDATDPFHPSEVHRLAPAGRVYRLTVNEGRLYSYAYWEGLAIHDLTVPSIPVQVGSIARPTLTSALTFWGNYALVGDREDGLLVYDMISPTMPVLVGQLAGQGLSGSCVVTGSTGLFGGGSYGLRIVDLSDPTMPAAHGAFGDNPTGLTRSVVSGDTMVGLDHFGDFYVLDVTDPAHPQPLSTLDLDCGYLVEDVVLQGTTAVVAAGCLFLIDVSDRLNPILLSSLEVTDSAGRVAVSGSTAYVLNITDVIGSAVVDVVDISDPGHPVLIGSSAPYGASDIDASGSLIYLAGGLNGLLILDAQDAVSIVPLSTTALPSGASEISVQSGLAYVAHSSRLSVFDVSDSRTPVEITTFLTPDYVRGFDLNGATAALRSRDLLTLLDISDPANPRLQARRALSAPSGDDLMLLGDLLYLNGSTMQIFDAAPCRICPADVNADRSPDVFDLLAFLDGWFANDGDIDGDSETTLLDLMEYVETWLHC